ncbi:hypothetical protein BDZ97DRAFT_1766087 [Flammula alnicola]|nr:hypothetical protein BDZ97DRAFT_1766087 [Flammula alnicola]
MSPLSVSAPPSAPRKSKGNGGIWPSTHYESCRNISAARASTALYGGSRRGTVMRPTSATKGARIGAHSIFFSVLFPQKNADHVGDMGTVSVRLSIQITLHKLDDMDTFVEWCIFPRQPFIEMQHLESGMSTFKINLNEAHSPPEKQQRPSKRAKKDISEYPPHQQELEIRKRESSARNRQKTKQKNFEGIAQKRQYKRRNDRELDVYSTVLAFGEQPAAGPSNTRHSPSVDPMEAHIDPMLLAQPPPKDYIPQFQDVNMHSETAYMHFQGAGSVFSPPPDVPSDFGAQTVLPPTADTETLHATNTPSENEPVTNTDTIGVEDGAYTHSDNEPTADRETANAEESAQVAKNAARVSEKALAVHAVLDLTNIKGVPADAETVEWSNGSRTYLPCIMEKNKNTLQQASRQKLVTFDTSPRPRDRLRSDFPTDVALTARIHQELAAANVVVLRGSPFQPVEMNADAIFNEFAIEPHRNIEALDATARLKDSKFPHLPRTLYDFCKDVDNPECIQCILDCPTLDGQVPKFVKHLDHGHNAWYRLHRRFPDEYYIPLDIQKSKSWLLFHQPLWHTYAHQDAEGFGTWTSILSGEKYWVIIRNGELYSTGTDRERYYEGVSPYSDGDNWDPATGSYREECNRYVIFGGPGDIIIQPPGTFHEVYTPTPSVTLGGHFYTYNTMHLTEVARAFDVRNNGKHTNQDHTSAQATIAMMMCALPLYPELALHRKPLAALCQILMDSTSYILGKAPDEPVVAKGKGKQKASKGKKKSTAKTPTQDNLYEYNPKDLAVCMADRLRKVYTLPHSSSKTEPPEERQDFIFDDGEWTDIGPVVDIADVIVQYSFE